MDNRFSPSPNACACVRACVCVACVRACVCVCVCVCVRERRKIELTVWGKKVPIALDGIRTCISGIRAHSASDCTTTAGTPPVSRNKHFRHSPVSSIVKQSCMQHSNSYLRDRDAKHLQGPPLSRTRRVSERRKIELTVWGKKVPIALDGIRTCISGIRAHSASDCTTTAGTPPVSRNKHFRHSPVSSIVKQSCMKHSNSYLRDRDAKHLQGPPLSRTRRVRERRKIELTVWGKKCPLPSTGFEPVSLGVCVCRGISNITHSSTNTQASSPGYAADHTVRDILNPVQYKESTLGEKIYKFYLNQSLELLVVINWRGVLTCKIDKIKPMSTSVKDMGYYYPGQKNGDSHASQT